MTIMIHKMHIILFIIFIIYTPIFCSGHHRKLLHQPFFPSDALPPTAQPPRQQPKYPFSSTSTPFFPLPFSPPPPPPPPPVTAAAVTFPANISSLSFKPPSTKPVSRKLVFLATALSVLAAALVASSAMIIVRFRHKKIPGMKRNENCRLFPPDISSSDKPSPAPTNISGEFLLLGTLRGVQENYNVKNGFFSSSAASSAGEYHRLSSPELRPLPPLPRHQPFSSEFFYHEEEEEQEEVFFSPNLSPSNNNNNNNNIKDSSNNATNNNNPSSPGDIFRNHGSNSINDSSRSSVSSFPVDSVSSNSPFRALNPSLGSLNLDSPDLIENDFRAKPIFRNGCSNETHNPFSEKDHFLGKRENLLIPFPPPLPPPRFWEYFEPGKGRQIAADNMEESSLKPRLKPLHWDKVRASSDRAMVWDQIKSSSFQLNEEMIETLFMVNGSGSSSSENTRRLAQAKSNEQNRVLDPKKSQNIAILLRALNVTVDEVGDALIEGTTDTLGSELLESLLKMAPSEDEERKLKESKDESAAKLGPAEKFLKAVLDIPFAFQRVDALLYIANFDSEVEYLEKSFETLKAACEELKNSRMFRKLLDAVLQTGNRVNLGTDRGDARAFKLDTLLKLVDVKGTDGKTTLLHFVVQEISYAEGSSQGSAHVKSDVESRKLGLLAVSGLSSELDNVKKAADMDSDALGVEVAKLFNGIGKIKDVLKLECGERFSGSMKGFLDRAEGAIVNLRSLESECSGSVKAIIEFFHGDSGKEDTRIFTVVRDFVSILDGVCKEVGKVNERNFVRSGLLVSSNIFPVFPATMIGIQT